MGEFLDSFKRRTKKLKRVRFQIPGTKVASKRNNLERHIKAFPTDQIAIEAYLANGGDMGGLFSGSVSEYNVF